MTNLRIVAATVLALGGAGLANTASAAPGMPVGVAAPDAVTSVYYRGGGARRYQLNEAKKERAYRLNSIKKERSYELNSYKKYNRGYGYGYGGYRGGYGYRPFPY